MCRNVWRCQEPIPDSPVIRYVPGHYTDSASAWLMSSVRRFNSTSNGRSSLFCDVTQRASVVSYGRFRTTYRYHSQGRSLKMWPIGCTEKSVITNLPSVTSLIREVLIYTAAAAWKHASKGILSCAGKPRAIFGNFFTFLSKDSSQTDLTSTFIHMYLSYLHLPCQWTLSELHKQLLN